VFDIVIPIASLFLMLGAGGVGVALGGQHAGPAIGLLAGLGMFVLYVIWALRLFAHGTTPGKRVLGMRVIKENGDPAGFGTMLLREWIGKIISGMILSLGYLWILIDKDRQAWHDKLAST